MSFSEEWEFCFNKQTHQSIWPWTDLVSLVHRHMDLKLKGCRVLEFGCGVGANIPFFLHNGIEYFAIEGSESAIQTVVKKFPSLINNIVLGDFTKDNNLFKDLDLIVDRAAMTHNTTSAISCGLKNAYKYLKPGGIYIGVDWFSTKHSDFKNGFKLADDFTRNNYSSGPFYGVGNVHFSDENHLEMLFSQFEILSLEYKTYNSYIPSKAGNEDMSFWNIVARKPHEK
ncbi:class I SAM-dependent methyltransferase [Deefgea piscis]|uniref:Class I SAM-dependent methyltransferase n=1 Tax=Deefgea piscis TaxID=2739061 RepID=A0A6M8SRS7_9NEIS|nr:class I SAM-dependent methyltransferase [Deefgea piscis]QKJ67895.1 class I SAM-dependent methyltransferase [Deefgea piscis]